MSNPAYAYAPTASPPQFGGAAGRITSAALGTNYQYGATYDALGRSTDLKLSAGSTTYIDQKRAFDDAGNVTTASTTVPGGTDNQAFCYDEQDRLTWAGSTGTPPCQTLAAGTLTAANYSQSFAYDRLGRLSSGPLGAYTYDPSHLHAASAIGSAYSAAYDAAGNMTCRAPSSNTTCAGTQTGALLGYNSVGALTAWQNTPNSPTGTAGFLYDGAGNRVEQQVTQGGTTTTTIYIGNLEQVAITGGTTTTTTFYYANGMRIAVAINGSVSYLASDGLGSANVAIKSADSSTSATLYAPYGTIRYSSGLMPTDYGFTGQHADAGLDYYNARYYDPAASQFVSPDNILQGNGYDVFGLSRYAYVEGNPMVRNDPGGHALCMVSSVSPSSSPGCGGSGDPVTVPNGSPPISARIAPGLREHPGTPVTRSYPCAYGMEDSACDAEIGNYAGIPAEYLQCRRDPECAHAQDEMSGIGMLFIPGPEQVVGMLGIAKGLGFIGERAIGFFAKLLGRSGARAVEDAGSSLAKGWRGTDRSTEESFAYYYGKHGAGRSPEQYAQDARNWAKDPTGVGKSVRLADGTPGMVYSTPGGGPGGILDSNGNIVSFWYR